VSSPPIEASEGFWQRGNSNSAPALKVWRVLNSIVYLPAYSKTAAREFVVAVVAAGA